MKFSDGYWLTKTGLRVQGASGVHEVETDADAVRVFASVRPVHSRGDTLDTALLGVAFDSPAEGVIRVTIERHAGALDRGPHFAVAGTAPAVSVARDDDAVSLTSGSLTARVSLGEEWRVDFLGASDAGDQSLLTSSTWRSVAHVTADTGETWVREQLTLEPGTLVYGLGERFGAFVKNGQSIDIWNEDGGTASEQAYKNVPFYLTNRGYGVFVDHAERVSFEVGSEMASRTQFSVAGERMTYYLIHGPSPKEVLARYTALTGRPARVPAWSWGLWLSTSFTTDYDEATVTSFIDGMAERDLPLSVFHFDCFWMRGFHWSDFIWDPATFPDPEGMLRRLHERDLKVCVWINPYIAQRSALFEEARTLGFLVRRRDGSVWQWDRWQAGMALVDFTNPAARNWFAGKLKGLLDQGVDAFKTDFGERIPTDVVWHDGSDPQKMHNFYTQLYNETVFDLLERERGDGDAVVFARSATVGGQKFPVHWGGDCESSYLAMAESLRGGLGLVSSGFGYWSHDIGGFEGTPDPDLFKRWIAFGLLSSHSRLHGSKSYRVPWSVDEESSEVLRVFTRLKMRLMPYLAALGEANHATGVPVMRPMMLEFPEDPTAHTLDRQYMLGPDLLVAPILQPGGEVTFYLPAGVWTHAQTGETLTGGRWHTKTFDYRHAAVYVRPGSVLPVGSIADRPDYAWASDLTLHVFEPDALRTSEVLVPAPHGGHAARIGVRASGLDVTATVLDGAAPGLTVLTGAMIG
ncbi:alpha-xylosidase [Curtobacterium ammoniigenes]|uniref:alpha-xylosidase n=1 Tax=Curtobacterium ammoniigenes TaxID=395387 RepID=UPI0008346E72|nr:alpha-xylosidase [Curtobacterium ammoniigenes]